MRFFGLSMIDGMVTVPGPVSLPQLSMTDITIGTIDDARLSANVVLADAVQALTNKTIDTADNSITVAQADVTGLTAALALKLDAASYTAADVLTKLLTVDGAGSGLDADLLDGNSSAAFVLASSYTAADVLTKLLTVDGAGSGLDADLLDGNSSAAFGLIGSTNTWTGTNIFTATRTNIQNVQPRLVWNETDAAAGTQQYEYLVSAGNQIRRMMNDDGTFGANYEVCTRSGNVITNWSLVATLVAITGNLSLAVAGNKLLVKEGSNAAMGVATLVGGTVTVSTNIVTANSRIFYNRATTGGTVGHLSLTISAGASFTINSTSATETSTVNWHIIEPA